MKTCFNNLTQLAFAVLLSVSSYSAIAQEQPGYLRNQTPAYHEILETYENLDNQNDITKLIKIGETDIGKPLHLFIIDLDKRFKPTTTKRVIFINNGIHPGEACGIDASIQFSKDLLSGKLNQKEILKNAIICIVPVYNVGGCLNRNSTSRQNQNGPELHGYRGNGRNLDLNRDFIKLDSKNAKSLVEAFHQWNPDVFIDTHSSNGADYQYIITLVNNQTNKLNQTLAKHLDNKMLPFMYNYLKKTGYEMTPYVETLNWNFPPDSGIVAFFDNARYAIGFTGLFNTFGFFTETHMWKPYHQRVVSTYHFIVGMSKFVNKNAKEISTIRQKARKEIANQNEFILKWSLDKTKKQSLLFKGYAAKTKTSEVTGLPRKYYDRNEPYEKEIDYFTNFKAEKSIKKPEYYIVPQAYTSVIERLDINNIEHKRLLKDTAIEVQMYYIEDFKTRNAYENHYMHYDVKVRPETQKIQFYKGDYFIRTNQKGNKYIVEVLEPESDDSFFAWNFFDGCLQTKEWFSPYIFEETAKEILEKQPEIKAALKKAIEEDPEMAQNAYAQLAFIHKNAIGYNKMYMRYPVFRINKSIGALPIN
jgi:hypothetical protein